MDGIQLEANGKGRKRKFNEMARDQVRDQNLYGNLLNLVQSNSSTIENVNCQANDSTKLDLLLATQKVSQTLNSLLDKIQELED